MISLFTLWFFVCGLGFNDYVAILLLQIDWEKGYEPYILGRKSLLPKYDSSFLGKGKNKVIHLAEIWIMG